ncbi:MAG: hypothetical protein RLZZ308_345 [Candidatus Parcubacteria bacterium]|jgi:23S rRNA (cytidine1920-2'-O)/16S rRNA (cytidine1409-2'-O)-methyltransferase
MRIDVLLVTKGLSVSRQESQELIKKGYVSADGLIIIKPSKDIPENTHITLSKTRKYVGRGGEKLEGALYHIFGNSEGTKAILLGKRALDVGSSTGGFTDCLLQHGIREVTAVDIGTSQLHSSLRNNPHVIVKEKEDIRFFVDSKPFDIIVADLSFISLEKVLEKIFSFGVYEAHYFLLLKPQFEVGKGKTKKGIVKDETLITSILTSYTTLLKEDYDMQATIFPCCITGGDGNQEYFLYCKKN